MSKQKKGKNVQVTIKSGGKKIALKKKVSMEIQTDGVSLVLDFDVSEFFDQYEIDRKALKEYLGNLKSPTGFLDRTYRKFLGR